mmetsp:Transcript_111026/g.254525  ORF Transcript_111026/g.254525 Transcript_111026/m.254525 type:complete len:524 (+) Transcript_111026:88-1659(+)
MNRAQLSTRNTFLEVHGEDVDEDLDLRRTVSAPDGKAAAELLCGSVLTACSTPESTLPQIDEEGSEQAPLTRTAHVDYHRSRPGSKVCREASGCQGPEVGVLTVGLESVVQVAETEVVDSSSDDDVFLRAKTAPEPVSIDALLSADSRDAALQGDIRANRKTGEACEAPPTAAAVPRSAMAMEQSTVRVKGTFLEVVDSEEGEEDLRRTVSAPVPGWPDGGLMRCDSADGSTTATPGQAVVVMASITEEVERPFAMQVNATAQPRANRSKRKGKSRHRDFEAPPLQQVSTAAGGQWQTPVTQHMGWGYATVPVVQANPLQQLGDSCAVAGQPAPRYVSGLGSSVVGIAPPNLHWHPSSLASGDVFGNGRCFMKKHFDGRLSLITEHEIRWGGMHRYSVRFTGNELSMADGVGFALAKRLPCPRNIQKIHSTFVSKRGYLCSRSGESVMRRTMGLPSLETGKLIVVTVNVDEGWVQFEVENREGTMTAAKIQLQQHARPGTRYHGAFCAVVKHEGVGIDFVDVD